MSPNQPFSFQKNRLRQPDQPRPLPNFTLATSRLPQKTSSLRRRYKQHPTGRTVLRRHESPTKFLKQPFQGRKNSPNQPFSFQQHPTGKTALRRHESPTKFLKQTFQGLKMSPNQPFLLQKVPVQRTGSAQALA
jgi:hypothetical protein